mgnify:CR=1 FL=1
MKKIFMAAAIFSNVCFAFTKVDFTLGGLTLNSNYNDVIKIYGEPTSKPGGYAQLVTDVIKYGDDVEIGFLGEKIRYIVTTADNGWTTPAGVRVGMYFDEVAKIYGADFTMYERTFEEIPAFMRESDEPYFEYEWTGKKYSWSEVAVNNFTYAPGDTTYIFSVIVNEGKVTAIEISQSTPEY